MTSAFKRAGRCRDPARARGVVRRAQRSARASGSLRGAAGRSRGQAPAIDLDAEAALQKLVLELARAQAARERARRERRRAGHGARRVLRDAHEAQGTHDRGRPRRPRGRARRPIDALATLFGESAVAGRDQREARLRRPHPGSGAKGGRPGPPHRRDGRRRRVHLRGAARIVRGRSGRDRVEAGGVSDEHRGRLTPTPTRDLDPTPPPRLNERGLRAGHETSPAHHVIPWTAGPRSHAALPHVDEVSRRPCSGTTTTSATRGRSSTFKRKTRG